MTSAAELRAAADRLEELGAPLVSYLTLRQRAAELDGRPTGDCFQRVGAFVIQHGRDWPGLVVCHGEVTDSEAPHGRIPHAWLEVPGEAEVADDDGSNPRVIPMMVVIDNTQPDPKSRVIPAPAFYEQTAGAALRRMDPFEYVRLVRLHGHDGPWPL